MGKPNRKVLPFRPGCVFSSGDVEPMPKNKRHRRVSRRDFLKTAGVWALAVGTGAGIALPRAVRASSKKLKILHWTHTDTSFYWWLTKYCEDWGNRNDIQVDLKQASQ